MTAEEFRAWLDANYPGHDRQGRRPANSHGPAPLAAASQALGLSESSIKAKRAGTTPITKRDLMMIKRLRPRRVTTPTV